MEIAEAKLSDDQKRAADEIMRWAHGEIHELTFAGLAGTGKTWVLGRLWPELAACGTQMVAPTGKAGSVLRSKGIWNASTFHSVVYNFAGTYVDEDENENPVFESKSEEQWRDGNIKRLACDESSMVNTKMCDDARDLGIPLLWVGDHGQLKPINGDPQLMKDPDIRLEKIHRQAEGNPIIALAHSVRNGAEIDRSFADGDRLKIGGIASDHRVIEYAHKYEIDQIVCAVNGKSLNQVGSRHRLNKLMRESLGFKEPIHVGDRLICTFNNRRRNLWNGQIFKVLSVNSETPVSYDVDLTAETAEGWQGHWRNVEISRLAMGNPDYKTSERDQRFCDFDYGYAITCHKAQGSQWNNVMVINGKAGWCDQKRWSYTAFTRAAQNLSVVLR